MNDMTRDQSEAALLVDWNQINILGSALADKRIPDSDLCFCRHQVFFQRKYGYGTRYTHYIAATALHAGSK